MPQPKWEAQECVYLCLVLLVFVNLCVESFSFVYNAEFCYCQLLVNLPKINRPMNSECVSDHRLDNFAWSNLAFGSQPRDVRTPIARLPNQLFHTSQAASLQECTQGLSSKDVNGNTGWEIGYKSTIHTNIQVLVKLLFWQLRGPLLCFKELPQKVDKRWTTSQIAFEQDLGWHNRGTEYSLHRSSMSSGCLEQLLVSPAQPTKVQKSAKQSPPSTWISQCRLLSE